MLRKIRTAAAVLAITLITLLFLDFTGTMAHWFGFMAKIQFLPAVLAVNAAVVIGLIVVTLLFGRIYCSVICPMGVLQDVISWISAKRKGKKARFSYSPEKKNLRYAVLLVFVILVAAGLTQIALFIAPYSAFGRIAETLLAPIWAYGNNLLAGIAEHYNSYAFYETDIWVKSLLVPVVAIVTLAVIAVLAWKNGRTWCNTICPVGTVLGFVSQYAIFRPIIDEKACKGCGLCAKKCKASAIDFKNFKVDTSRCVACFDCIDACNAKAIDFKNRLTVKKEESTNNCAQQAVNDETVDTGRRSFLIGAGLLA
ncbi:MAG: 4Fe-4S binding protein, partial [Paludibacteraceae bacterium]|nr:4Fe-4S binding protein [Paludibacteraceae bacterium]